MFWINPIQILRVSSGRKVAGAIKSLVNAKVLKLECSKVLHEGLLVPVLLYGNETMIWKKRIGLGLGLCR